LPKKEKNDISVINLKFFEFLLKDESSVVKQGKFIGLGAIDTVAPSAVMSSLVLQADGSTKLNSHLETGSG
jgi:hypothetical protein